MPRLLLAASVAALSLVPARTAAGAPEALRVPAVEGLTLDGRPEEAGWKDALVLPADPVLAPPPPPGTEKVRLMPDVRVAQSGGRLWLSVAMAEDPGMGMGLRVLVGPEGIAGAQDAVQVTFAPQEIRTARFVVRGPRGLTRKEYRVEGVAEWRRAGSWSLEVSLPLEDLGLAAPSTPLRLALAADSRTNNLGSAAPAGVLFAEASKWALLQPAGGAWTSGAVVDPAPLLAEDAKDDERIRAWREFDVGQHTPLPPGPPAAVRKQVEEKMFTPLERIAALRPDLEAWALWVKGGVLLQLDEPQGAETAYRRALAVMPGCREADFQLHVKLLGQAHAEGLPSQPSDYAAALARIDAARQAAQGPYAAEGLLAARGLLLYKRGDFLGARDMLAPLVKRYPHDALFTFTLAHVQKYVDAKAQEDLHRQAEDRAGDLPRVRLTTSRGPITLDLFEDDAPNTVKNFVWLADRGFYDGTAFHRNVPFFCLQGGDPFTREGADPRWVGGGGPGYAIETEPEKPRDPDRGRRRLPLRGVIAMASRARDTEGSQFFLTTGTAAHLEGTVSVFGRVVEGQDVLDALVQDDLVVKVEVLRRRPGTEYRPITLGRAPAPEPKPTPPAPR